jgi:hypothetical protein
MPTVLEGWGKAMIWLVVYLATGAALSVALVIHEATGSHGGFWFACRNEPEGMVRLPLIVLAGSALWLPYLLWRGLREVFS